MTNTNIIKKREIKSDILKICKAFNLGICKTIIFKPLFEKNDTFLFLDIIFITDDKQQHNYKIPNIHYKKIKKYQLQSVFDDIDVFDDIA